MIEDAHAMPFATRTTARQGMTSPPDAAGYSAATATSLIGLGR